jgi:hypothetical protein
MRRAGVLRYRGIGGWGSGAISVGSFRFSRRFGRRVIATIERICLPLVTKFGHIG